MGFLCNKKSEEKNVSQVQLFEQNFLRDIGLDNIITVNTDTNFCVEVFKNPQFYVEGATKLYSGMTLTGCMTGYTQGIYNLDYVSDFSVKYFITGNTNYFDYVGSFGTKTFSKDTFKVDKATNLLIDGSEIINNVTPFNLIKRTNPSLSGGSISVNNTPNSITFNQTNNKLYVVNKSSNNVSVIDCDDNSITNTITGFTNPHSCVYNINNNKVYVTNQTASSVSVINCETNTVTSTISSVGTAPTYMTYNTNNNSIYVTDQVTSSIYVINCNTNSITATITGNTPTGLSNITTGNTLYVTNTSSNNISVIDCSSNIVTSTISFSGTPFQLAYSSRNNNLYVNLTGDTNIYKIDCNDNTIKKTIPISAYSYTLTYNQGGNSIYTNNYVNNTVSIIDCDTDLLFDTISANNGPISSVYNNLNNKFYVVNNLSDNVTILSASTLSTINQVFSLGGIPKTWGEYMIRTYYTFYGKICNLNTFTNSWLSYPQQNLFDNSTDYYFMTVINPPKPSLAPPPMAPVTNYNFIQDVLLVDGLTSQRTQEAVNDALNYFILKAKPSNPSLALIFVNGIKMSYQYDYLIKDSGPSTPSVLVFNDNISIKRTDIIVANYIVGVSESAGDSDYSKWFSNTESVTNITLDTNPGDFPDKMYINKNTVTGNYELYVTQPIDPNNSVFLTINGIEMIQDRQFYLSSSQKNRIILDKKYTESININDIISILAVSPNLITGDSDYGSLTKNQFYTQWTINSVLPENVTGKFLIQVCDEENDYSNILYEKMVNYEQNKTDYDTTITDIAIGNYYKFRVLFETTYKGYLNNEITTCSYSEGYFNTKSDYINNSY